MSVLAVSGSGRESVMANPPLRSMTGFARVRHPLGDGELVVSAKSVNSTSSRREHRESHHVLTPPSTKG